MGKIMIRRKFITVGLSAVAAGLVSTHFAFGFKAFYPKDVIITHKNGAVK